MNKFEIVDLTVIGNEEDGYSIIDTYETGVIVKLNTLSEKEILKAIEPKIPVYISEDSDEVIITICRLADNMPLIELRRIYTSYAI